MSGIRGLLQTAFPEAQIIHDSDEQCAMLVGELDLVVTVTVMQPKWMVSLRESEGHRSLLAIEKRYPHCLSLIREVCDRDGFVLHDNCHLEKTVPVDPMDAATIRPQLQTMMTTFKRNIADVVKARVKLAIKEFFSPSRPAESTAQRESQSTPAAAPPPPPTPPPVQQPLMSDRLENRDTLNITRQGSNACLFEGRYGDRSVFVRQVDVRDENKERVVSLLSRLMDYTRESRERFPVPRPAEAALEIDGFIFGEVRELSGSFQIVSRPPHEAQHVLVVMERVDSAMSLTRKWSESLLHEEFHEYPLVQTFHRLAGALSRLQRGRLPLLSAEATSFQLSPSFIYVYPRSGGGGAVDVAVDLVSLFFPPPMAPTAAEAELVAVLQPEELRHDALLTRVRYSLGMLLALSFYSADVGSFAGPAAEVRSTVRGLLDEPPLPLSLDVSKALSEILPGLIDPAAASHDFATIEQWLCTLEKEIRRAPPTFTVDSFDRGEDDRDRRIRRIGRGGQANVFRAYHLKKRRFVALKELTRTSDQTDALRHEIRLLSALGGHDNIVTLYGVLAARLSSTRRSVPPMTAPDGEGDADDEVTTLEEVEDGGAGRASSAATTAQAAAAAPAAAMGSSGLSSIYEAQREATRTVMVMEYCPDGDLATWLAAHHPTAAPTPPTYYETHFVTALQLLYDVVSGMCHLHERKVLHGDLKPQNILLTRSPRGRLVAKIADFGIARPTVREPGCTSQTITEIAVDGRGTPLYVAPEMGGRRCTRLADVYSFAIVLHDCLVTHRPSHKFLRLGGRPLPPQYLMKYVRDLKWRPLVDQVDSDGYDPLSPWPDTPEPYKARFRTMMTDCWQEEHRKRPQFAELEERFEAIFNDNDLPVD
eukprot:gene10958-7796_t